jgi:hypothetical protein
MCWTRTKIGSHIFWQQCHILNKQAGNCSATAVVQTIIRTSLQSHALPWVHLAQRVQGSSGSSQHTSCITVSQLWRLHTSGNTTATG